MDTGMDDKYTPISDENALIAANANNTTIFEKKEDGEFKEVTENKDNFRQGLFTKKEVKNQDSIADNANQSELTSEPQNPTNKDVTLDEPVLNSNEGTKTTTTKEVIPGVTKKTSKLLFSLANDPNAINEIAEVITKHNEQNETTASGTSAAAGGRRRTKHKKGGKKSHKKGKSSKKVAKRRKSRKTGTRRSRKQNKH